MSEEISVEEFVKDIIRKYPVHTTQRLESYVRQKAREQANFSHRQQEEFKKTHGEDLFESGWEEQEMMAISKIHGEIMAELYRRYAKSIQSGTGIDKIYYEMAASLDP